MIAYREAAEEEESPATLLARCRALAEAGGHDASVELLIELGMLEAALVDRLMPERDGLDPLAARLRQASLAAARLVRASWRGEPATTAPVLAAIDAIGPVSGRLRLGVPEGYAWYALYPEAYLEAAERFAAGPAGPARALCLGLRGIGTGLSAMAAAGLEAHGWQVESHTLRPRGHPFDRRPVLTAELAATLAADPQRWFLIVDEGPGLSGSSFAGAAALLADLGIPEARILLCPAHLPDPAGFRSPLARTRWPRHRKLHVPFEEGRWRPPDALDLSAGAWRRHLGLPEERWPALVPWHERRKYLADRGRVLHRFAGLGRWGRRALARARDLAEAGFTPPPLAFNAGFLAQPFVPGRPLLDPAEADGSLLAFAARYLAHLARRHRLPRPARVEPLLEMIRVNLAEAFGSTASLADLERQARSFGEIPAVALDGRMLAHEWLRTADGGWLKTDALDHHADHFFPGEADLAWDVAALQVELGLAEPAVLSLAAATGDRHLAARLPFYRTAWLAFRLGYATLAGDADEGRMRRLAERCRRQLASAPQVGCGSAPRSQANQPDEP